MLLFWKLGCLFKFIPYIFSIYRFTHFDTPLLKHGPFSDLVLDQTSRNGGIIVPFRWMGKPVIPKMKES